MNFDRLLHTAQARGPKRIAVPMANDPDILACIGMAMKLGIAEFVLIGERDKIERIAQEQNVSLGTSQFIPETDEVAACALAARLVRDGKADIMMKGLVQTSTFSKAFLNKELGLIPEGRVVSLVALFEVPAYHKSLIVTDAALNIAPTLETKKQLIRNAVDFAIGLGIANPKVACVCPNEKVNKNIPSTVDAAELTALSATGAFAPAIVDGPYGLDVAVSKHAAKIKNISTAVAGDADILLLPTLDAANAVYKSLTMFGNARTASVIQGAKCPIVLTSRADSEDTKLYSIIVATCLSGMPAR
jgi:phosphate butyryltransferase